MTDDQDDQEQRKAESERPTCPKCNSATVSADGDTVEQLDTNGQLVGSHYYGWWTCEYCMHQWRYQDEKFNP